MILFKFSLASFQHRLFPAATFPEPFYRAAHFPFGYVVTFGWMDEWMSEWLRGVLIRKSSAGGEGIFVLLSRVGLVNGDGWRDYRYF
jgi:hypothetical protein